jgi:hypothetical protein
MFVDQQSTIIRRAYALDTIDCDSCGRAIEIDEPISVDYSAAQYEALLYGEPDGLEDLRMECLGCETAKAKAIADSPIPSTVRDTDIVELAQ